MKKLVLLSLVSSLTLLSANNVVERSYKVGYSKGYKAGYNKGLMDARKEYLKALKILNAKIKGLGLGLALSSKGKITPPIFMKIKDGSQVKIVSSGCEIVGSLTPDVIAQIPTINKQDIKIASKIEEKGVTNFYASFDKGDKGFIDGKQISKNSLLILKNTPYLLNIVEKSGVKFETNEDFIYINFRSFNEKVDFLKRYDINPKLIKE